MNAPVASPIYLASRSPRRRAMLASAGVRVHARASLDDSLLVQGRVSPAQWTLALAYAKARWLADRLADRLVEEHADAEAGRSAGRDSGQGRSAGRVPSGGFGPPRGTVLAADTVCVVDGRVLGQPADAAAARAMLVSFLRRAHEVVTGVCLIDLGRGERSMLADTAIVRWGDVDPEELERYLAGDGWRGKAGGYNLAERMDAGWPITCSGDPCTVMGLPMERLAGWLPVGEPAP